MLVVAVGEVALPHLTKLPRPQLAAVKKNKRAVSAFVTVAAKSVSRATTPVLSGLPLKMNSKRKDLI